MWPSAARFQRVAPSRPSGPTAARGFVARTTTDLDVGGIEPLIERSRILLGLRSLPVDDKADRNSLGRFRNQSVGEGVADGAWPEPELIDVDRGRRGADVLEHWGVEVPSLDVNVDGRRAALGERESCLLTGSETNRRAALRSESEVRDTPQNAWSSRGAALGSSCRPRRARARPRRRSPSRGRGWAPRSRYGQRRRSEAPR